MKYFVSLIIIVTLTGCGLKGSLYETPIKSSNEVVKQEQPVEEQEK